ncbi:MAG: nucleotidyltransferase domain-containing protein [Candidatus Competibacterales bacterium]|nr:nucleotidyltransferase domain-containing protein [Candidatus Competibacterales bacterium]
MNVPDSLLRDIVDAAVTAVDPEWIVLFGSHARGGARPDSDIDLLVVEREPFTATRGRQDELKRLRRAFWRFRVPIDVLLYSREEIDRWRESPNHVIGRSLREGVTLYERP